MSPAGSDTNDGSPSSPLQTIQAGLDRATPGTQITLAPGIYREQLQTTRDGTADAPIWIKGPETGTDRPGRYQAVVYGTDRVLSVDNSHYVFNGFTIDGQEQLANVAFPTDLGGIDTFKLSVQAQVEDGRLIYIGASDESRDLTGIAISNMFLSGAGGECVRLRNNAHDNVVVDSTPSPACAPEPVSPTTCANRWTPRSNTGSPSAPWWWPPAPTARSAGTMPNS